eukprot:jgi/Pico_ML_1/55119/g866.t1
MNSGLFGEGQYITISADEASPLSPKRRSNVVSFPSRTLRDETASLVTDAGQATQWTNLTLALGSENEHP